MLQSKKKVTDRHTDWVKLSLLELLIAAKNILRRQLIFDHHQFFCAVRSLCHIHSDWEEGGLEDFKNNQRKIGASRQIFLVSAEGLLATLKGLFALLTIWLKRGWMNKHTKSWKKEGWKKKLTKSFKGGGRKNKHTKSYMLHWIYKSGTFHLPESFSLLSVTHNVHYIFFEGVIILQLFHW